MRPLAFVAPIAALLLLAACDVGASGPPAAAACVKNADCENGQYCQFSATGGCGAEGECGWAPNADAGCSGGQAACSCAGNEVQQSVCVVGGYVLGTPVRSVGACGGGSSATDAGADAATDSGIDASAD